MKSELKNFSFIISKNKMNPLLLLMLVFGICCTTNSSSEKNISVMTDSTKKYTMLCLGDSYTIGELVNEEERFPNQAVQLLRSDSVFF